MLGNTGTAGGGETIATGDTGGCIIDDVDIFDIIYGIKQ